VDALLNLFILIMSSFASTPSRC